MTTVPDWLDGVERHPGAGSGPMIDGAAWKLLLHTTEGPTLAGALGALDAKRAWSHFVYDPAADHLVQCVPMNQAARALKSGGSDGKTNAAKVIQIEIVGTAATSQLWPATVTTNLGHLIARLAAVAPFRPVFGAPFYGQDAGFTVASASARQRMDWPTWYSYDAICGHQHAPDNDHWDPGKIPVAAIARAIEATNPTPPAPIPEDDMFSDQDRKLLQDVHDQLTVSRDDKSPLGPTVRWLLALLKRRSD